MTPGQALREFADMLDRRQPSKVQLKTGNRYYNTGAANALKWAAQQAREQADKLDKP
jgi:hypothetical protein